MPLGELIRQLSAGTRAHVCIHDVSGILNAGPMRLDDCHRIHSMPFCCAAKATSTGFRLCIHCKMLANRKAAEGRRLFHAYCPYGLYEVVQPVLIGGQTQCIIYVGNLIFSPEESGRRIDRACQLTHSPAEVLRADLADAERIASPDTAIRMAGLIDSYIRLLAGHIHIPAADAGQPHWAVEALRNYIQLNYNQSLSLRNASRLYFVNDKYIGRLFRRQTGQTFHEYLNTVRMEKAAAFLQDPEMSVLSVAFRSGFQNVSYFNRLFRRQYGMSPSKYRRRTQEG